MAATEDTPVELSISEEKISFLVIKAREFDMKVDPIDPNSGSDGPDDGEREVLEDLDDDLTETELRDALAGLTEDEAFDLVTMVWIGRGDYEASDWAEARELARERHSGETVDYLIGIPMLGDLIEEGYAALGYNTEDTDAKHL